jgi:osmoprotectant transport system ATP-binding protein
MLHRGGTTARADDSLRAALDAALSSPSGRGVIVDADGRLLGTVSVREVIDRIEADRATRQAAAEDAGPASQQLEDAARGRE